MKRIAGIDVSKKKLDCYSSVLKNSKSFFNTENGIKKLVEWLLSQNLDFVVMESTGKYHLAAWYACSEAKIGTVIANPRRVRDLTKGLGFIAKTDELDSKLLCFYGEKAEVKLSSPPTKKERELKELVATRRQLVESRVQLLNKKSSALDNFKTHFDVPIAALNKQLKELEDLIDTKIDEIESLKKKKELLMKVKGIGPKVVAVLLVYLPELGSLNRREIASLAGLAPYNKDSGNFEGRRHIHGGRTAVRCALFQSILTCIQSDEKVKNKYINLVSKGKPKKVAMIACARKYLVMLNTLLKNNNDWNPNYPQSNLAAPKSI